MPKFPKTLYVFLADDDPDSFIATGDQDGAFPLNDDGPVTVGVYELRSTMVQQKKTVVLRSKPAAKGGR